jgi:hypothetical protein
MDALVRDVIVHFGLPFTVLSVAGSPIEWNVHVRSDETAKVISFTVAGGRPAAMRVAIQQMLEAAF